MGNKHYIQSVERAMDILAYIADNSDAGLSDISSRLGLNTSTAFGILQTLEHTGFISRNTAGLKYCLGIRSLKLGLCYNFDNSLSKNIHDVLSELAASVGETCYFEIRIGSKYYYYDVVLAANPLKVVPDSKGFIDLPDNSAVSKVYNTYRTGQQYATDLEEVMEGLNCFAAPVMSYGDILGCIAVSGPSSRFTKEAADSCFSVYCDIMKAHGLENCVLR